MRWKIDANGDTTNTKIERMREREVFFCTYVCKWPLEPHSSSWQSRKVQNLLKEIFSKNAILSQAASVSDQYYKHVPTMK